MQFKDFFLILTSLSEVKAQFSVILQVNILHQLVNSTDLVGEKMRMSEKCSSHGKFGFGKDKARLLWYKIVN
jgi:hypothetical protein